MYVMKKILSILILIGVFYCLYRMYCYKREHLTSETLRNPAHLPATIERVTNTILTAAPSFSDKMDTLTLPKNVQDNFNEWIDKGFVSPIKDQMLCGGCWAFATCGSLADRLTIATNGQWYTPFGLSEQILISCGGDMGMEFYQGCEGGIPHTAIDAISKKGVPADSKCLNCGGRAGAASGNGASSRSGVVNPNDTTTCSAGGSVYSATEYTWWQTGCNSNTSCSLASASTCPCTEVNNQMKSVQSKDTPFAVKYKTIGEAHGYTSHGDQDELETVDLWPDIPQSTIDKNVDRMKKAIYYEGPITVGYRVTADFYTFWPTSSADNYYKYDGRSQMRGGHAVVIVGWKKLKGIPVWIIKNSWGENAGYGFPTGPKWKDPVTGKMVPKYIGGFWNHIMGINDSFIESNASGAHPDLRVPQISIFLSKDIPADWYDTITLRDIYNQTAKKPTTPTPPLPDVTPIPEYVPVEITSDKFNIVTLTPENITTDSISAFFEEKDSMYMVGAENTDTIEAILGILPANKTYLSQSEVEDIAEQIKDSIKEYIIIATKGSTNNYYHMDGDPVYWNIFTKNYAHRAATLKKFASDIFSKFQGLRLQAPVVQVSTNSLVRYD